VRGIGSGAQHKYGLSRRVTNMPALDGVPRVGTSRDATDLLDL
jgi:hypothetical protein